MNVSLIYLYTKIQTFKLADNNMKIIKKKYTFKIGIFIKKTDL